MDKTIKASGHTTSKGKSRKHIRDTEIRRLAEHNFKKIDRPSNGYGAWGRDEKYVNGYAKEYRKDLNQSMSMAYFAGEFKISKGGKIEIIPDMEWLDTDWLLRSERSRKGLRLANKQAYAPFRCTECKKAWAKEYGSSRDYGYLGSLFNGMLLIKKICPRCKESG
jgi:hypothetical protein